VLSLGGSILKAAREQTMVGKFMGLGTAFGAALGAAFGNVATGVALGVLASAVAGFGMAKRKGRLED